MLTCEKAIFLVGGFGSSHYLLQSIKSAHPKIQIIQPADAWSAIVQGAVLSKLPKQATVTVTVADNHYGVRAGVKYNPQRDSEREKFKYWDEYEEFDRIDRMNWYINRGDDLVRSRSVDFAFVTHFDIDPPAEQLRETYYLRSCTADEAPEYPEDCKSFPAQDTKFALTHVFQL